MRHPAQADACAMGLRITGASVRCALQYTASAADATLNL